MRKPREALPPTARVTLQSDEYIDETGVVRTNRVVRQNLDAAPPVDFVDVVVEDESAVRLVPAGVRRARDPVGVGGCRGGCCGEAEGDGRSILFSPPDNPFQPFFSARTFQLFFENPDNLSFDPNPSPTNLQCCCSEDSIPSPFSCSSLVGRYLS